MAHRWILWDCQKDRIFGRFPSEEAAEARAIEQGYDDYNVFPCEDLPKHELPVKLDREGAIAAAIENVGA